MNDKTVVLIMTIWGFYVVAWYIATMLFLKYDHDNRKFGTVWLAISLTTVIMPLAVTVLGFAIMIIGGFTYGVA